MSERTKEQLSPENEIIEQTREAKYNLASPVDPKNPRHYVDNSGFYQALVDYRAAVLKAETEGLPRPLVPNYIGACFLKIANGQAMNYNFRNYSYINDMKSAAVEDCLKGVLTFDPERTKNPFSYFSQATFYAFLGVIAKEKRQTRVKREMFSWFDVDTFTSQDHEDNGEFNIHLNEFISSLGDDKQMKKPAKKRKGKELVTPVTEMFDQVTPELGDLLTDIIENDEAEE